MAAARTETGQVIREPKSSPTNGGGAIQKRPDPAAPLVSMLETLKGELARAVPKHLTPDRLARLALTALRTTKDMTKCSRESFAASVMTCAVLGLEPNTPLGQAWLIPRKNSKLGTIECTVIIGYQGMLDLARRSGMVAGIQAVPVFQGDTFRYSLGLAPTIEHIPNLDDPTREDPKKLTHVYAVCHLKESGTNPVFVVLSKAQVEQRRKRGGSRSFSPWDTDYIAMACKTAIRDLFRWMPRSSEFQRVEMLEAAAETGGSQFDALPEAQARALLGAGYGPAVTDDGEVLEAEYEDPTNDPREVEADREPGED